MTKCKYGGVFSEYGGIGGNQSLKELGVIMASDLNPYQAMIVASLLFGNSRINREINLQNYFSNKILIWIESFTLILFALYKNQK